MKHALTSMAAIIAAAGLGSAAQAQSMTPPGTSPSQTMQSTPATGQTPQTYGSQSNAYPPPQQPGAAQATGAPQQQWNSAQQQNPAQWNAGQQPPAGTANLNQAQQNGIQQRQAIAPQGSMEPPAGGQISRDTVRQAQEQLRAQGLYRGADDGVVGSSTTRAVTQFQRRNGLPVTGSLDGPTLNRLTGSSAQGYGASAGQAQAPMQPMANPTMSQAPNSGAYNANTGASNPNPGAYNAQGNPPMQR